MALNVGTLYAELKIEDGQFSSKLGQAEAQLKRVDQTAGKAGGAVRDMGAAGGTAGQQINTGMGQAERGAGTLTAALGKAKTVAAGLGLVLGARQAVGFFTDAINGARDAEAYMLRVQNTFGDAEGSISDWAKTAGDAFRMSENSAKDAALSFSTFGIVLDKSGQDLADYSTGLTELAADLAAYGDYDLATVVNDMTSALSGQAVPMRKYGVLLDEATLRQVAFEEGITESNRELSQSEKVLATTAALHSELGYAVGANEAAAGTFGDSMRDLSARFQDTTAEIGQAFLPIANSMVQLLAGPGLTALSAFGDVLGAVGEAVELAGRAFGALPGPVQAAIGMMVAAKLASMALGTELGTKMVAKVAAGRTALATFATTAGTGTATALRTFRTNMVTAGGGVRGFTSAVGTAAVGGLNNMRAGIGNVVNALGGPWMIGLAAATIGIGKFMQSQAETKARLQENADTAKNLGEQLEDTGGKYTKAGEEAAKAAIEAIKLSNDGRTLSATLEGLGIDADKAARGLAGMGGDMADVREELEEMAGDTPWDMSTSLEYGAINVRNARQSLAELDRLEQETAERQAKIAERSAEIQESLNVDFGIDIDPAGLDAITDAMEDFADTTKSATDRIGALTSALDQIWADKFTEEAAFVSYGEALDGIVKSLEDLDHSAINADGSLNLMDATARDLFGGIETYASSMSQMAATMLLSGESMDDVSAMLEGQRQSFIDAGVAMGFTEEQMIALADRYGLIPDDVTLNVQAAGIEPAMQAVEVLGDKIDGIQDGKIITTEVLSDEAIADLEALGLKVEKTPDGKRMEITTEGGGDAELLFELLKSYVNNDNDKNMTVNVDGHEFAKTTLDELIDLVNTDNEKDIVVDSNATEVIELLDALNITTTTLDDGTVVITDNADDVRARVNRLNGMRTSSTHFVNVSAAGSAAGSAAASGARQILDANADGSIRVRAQGALDTAQIRNGAGDGIVQHTGFGPVQWAEGETGWEAFIPGAASKRRRSTQILVETARRMGYGVIPLDAIRTMADGGVVESITGIAADVAPALQVTSSHRPGDPGHHGSGNAVDLSNGTGNTDEMLAFANYMADNYRGELAELIYHDPRFSGRQIKNGQFVDDSFYAGAGDHTNHVHVAAMQPLGQPAMGDDAAVMDALNSDDERTRNAAIIIDEGRKRGMSDKAIRTALATALVESDLRTLANPNDPESLNYEHSGLGYDHDSSGVFQQRANGAWGTAADRMDTRSSAGMFYDELAKQDLDSMDEGSAAQAVQRSAFPGAYAERVDEADELLRTIGAQTGTSSSGSARGDGQPVYVTNWPTGFGLASGGTVARSSTIPDDMPPIADVIEEADPEGEAHQIDLASIPKAGGEAAGKGLLSDLGIGQGGVIGALLEHGPELAGIATAAAGHPEFAGLVTGGGDLIINVTDLEGLGRELQNEQSRQSLGFKGSGR